MITVGIILFLIGLVAAVLLTGLAPDPAPPNQGQFIKLCWAVCVIGIVAIVLGLILDIADGSNNLSTSIISLL